MQLRVAYFAVLSFVFSCFSGCPLLGKGDVPSTMRSSEAISKRGVPWSGYPDQFNQQEKFAIEMSYLQGFAMVRYLK
jgi:hypothetical protein